MIIGGLYSFNGGNQFLAQHYPGLLQEVYDIISLVDADKHKLKESRELRTAGRLFYSPPLLNRSFKEEFKKRGWGNRRVESEYPTTYYAPNYQHTVEIKGAFRDMDFVKEKVGVEVQFGKYSFMVYNVCAKMTIFHNRGHIDAGIEIVPMKHLVQQMSSGVSYFEQFVWDLEQRGISNIDIPVLILGIDAQSSLSVSEYE
jgi:Restriction endonuclease BglII